MDESIYKIALSQLEGVGSITAKRLVSYCGGLEAVFRAKRKTLLKIPGVGPGIAQSVLNFRNFESAEREMQYCEENQIDVYLYSDGAYPQRLKQCEDSPVTIFSQGRVDLNGRRVLSLVGTRKPTTRGRELVEEFVSGLTGSDVIVISGMAYGIDGLAHKSSVKHQIPTVGVLAHGLDRVYPRVHSTLAREMLENGGLLSEFPTGTNPDRENFPRRNRIVAGLADATVVVESDRKGGSMITADLAFQYNREVFAFPGRPDDRFSSGCNALIRWNKAALIHGVEDFLKDMQWDEKGPQVVQPQLFDLTAVEERCLKLLRSGRMVLDDIAARLNMPVSDASTVLLALEFKDAIRALPGKVFEARH